MNVNFKLFASFLAVAQNESFSRAATATNKSLPAISMQIKQLEEQLGVALFQRTTRKVMLTREGEQLMISVRKAQAELEVGLAQIQHAVDAEQGHISFACVPTVACSRLPAILASFASQRPGITLHVRELINEELLQCVRKREVDFAIGPIPGRLGEFDYAPLFADAYCALLPEGYNHGGRDAIGLRELAKLPLLKLSSASVFRDHMDVALREHNIIAKTDYEFTQVNTLVAMAEAGLGVALLPHTAIPRHTTLKSVRIIEPEMSRVIAIITIKGHTLSPAAARLVTLCHREMAPVALA